MRNESGSPIHSPTDEQNAWHALTGAEAMARLTSGTEGLSGAEAARRLVQFGSNRLPEQRGRSTVTRLAAQFNNVLIYVLILAAVTAAILGEAVDSGLIAGVVVINALIGFVQEGRAERAMEAIRTLLAPTAAVLRDGRRIDIKADRVVPGDIVSLEAGDRVPADLRIIWSRTLRIQESLLTGESETVDKIEAPVAADVPLGDRQSMAYSGTLVTYGRGTGVVVATGSESELGRVSDLLAHVEVPTTPLLTQISAFGRWLTFAILLLASATFAIGTGIHGNPMDAMFLAAVGLIVAAIPEGLPAVITVTLAIGVERMARRNSIVRRLPAVETLGSVTVVCSDKTGTFTRNEMTVQEIVTAKSRYSVTGSGYEQRGELLLDGLVVAPTPEMEELLRGALLCSDASLQLDGTEWIATGDPVDAALQVAGMKTLGDLDSLRKTWPRTDEIPFDSDHRFMATLHHDHTGHNVIFVKGAPESLFDMCDSQETDTDNPGPFVESYWREHANRLATGGKRVLALATKKSGGPRTELTYADMKSGFTFVGLFGISDPPREEAIRAVADCHNAGIHVKMITGDHAVTAAAIAARIGLHNPSIVMTGAEVDVLSNESLKERVGEVDVFARVSPANKLALVEALQAQGELVAVTGDGVNDAPALRRADIGIAMGKAGSEAAKEAAEMVLADDNFATIAHAIEEGRRVYDNIKKAVLYILPTSAGEALTIVAAVALGLVLPITAVQILWINMVTAVTLALVFAFEPIEPGTMQRRPRPVRESLLSALLIWRIVLVSVILVIGVFGVFTWAYRETMDIEIARTAAVNTLVMFEIFYLFSVRRGNAPAFTGLFSRGAWLSWAASAVVMTLQLIYTYSGVLNDLFGSKGLNAVQWAVVIGVTATIFLIVEVERVIAGWRRPAMAPSTGPGATV